MATDDSVGTVVCESTFAEASVDTSVGTVFGEEIILADSVAIGESVCAETPPDRSAGTGAV